MKNLSRFLIVAVIMSLFMGTASAAIVSVDDIQYTGNSEFFDGEMFSIYFVSSSNTDQIQAYVSPQQLSDGQNNIEAQNGLNIDITSQNFQARYETQTTDLRPIPKLKPVDRKFDSKQARDEWAYDKCYNGGDSGEPNGLLYSNLDWSFEGDLLQTYGVKCAIVDGNEGLWQPSRIQNPPRETFETTFKVQADGETQYEKTLTNSEIAPGTSTKLGEHVRVQWQGNLDTGRSAPNPTNSYALHNDQYGWRIVSQSSYNSYFNTFGGTNIDDIMTTWHDGGYDKEQVKNLFTEEYQSATSEYQQSPLHGATVEGNGISGGTFIKDLTFTPSYPSFIVYTDAEYVEVRKTVGQPEIVSTTAPNLEVGAEIQEGKTDSTGQVDIEVRNSGKAEGSFYTRLQCDASQFQSQGVSDTQTVQPGGTASFSNKVSFGNTGFDGKEIQEECNVVAKDVNSLETDEASVTLTGIQANTCIPGTRATEDLENNRTQVLEWKEGCQEQTELAVCEADEYADLAASEGNICKSTNNPSTTPIDECDIVVPLLGKIGEDPLCEASGLNAGTIAQGLVSLFMGLIGFGLGRKTAEWAEIDKEQTQVIIGLVTGLALGAIVFALWSNPLAWIGLIVLLVGGGYLFIQLAPLLGLAGASSQR